jgi:glycosyltransferase involved in cell wall biosynthesis
MKRLDLACVVSVYNEQVVLRQSVQMLVKALQQYSSNFMVIIASNGSTDSTITIARELEAELPGVVRLLVCKQKGRGWALREAIGGVSADRYLFLDVDLPLELGDLGAVLAKLDESDLVVCRRTGYRPPMRWVMTWCLRQVNRWVFGMRVSDSQCSVKALTPAAARLLVSDCRQNGWYLDTELVVLAHRRGLKIAEVPIHWIEQRFGERHSKVKAGADTVAFLKALREIWLRRRALGAGGAE